MPRPSENDYPVSLTLRFKSVKAKDEFLGQLSDGYGENEVELKEWRIGDDFYEADKLAVDVYDTRDWRSGDKTEPDEVI